MYNIALKPCYCHLAATKADYFCNYLFLTAIIAKSIDSGCGSSANVFNTDHHSFLLCQPELLPSRDKLKSTAGEVTGFAVLLYLI